MHRTRRRCRCRARRPAGGRRAGRQLDLDELPGVGAGVVVVDLGDERRGRRRGLGQGGQAHHGHGGGDTAEGSAARARAGCRCVRAQGPFGRTERAGWRATLSASEERGTRPYVTESHREGKFWNSFTVTHDTPAAARCAPPDRTGVRLACHTAERGRRHAPRTIRAIPRRARSELRSPPRGLRPTDVPSGRRSRRERDIRRPVAVERAGTAGCGSAGRWGPGRACWSNGGSAAAPGKDESPTRSRGRTARRWSRPGSRRPAGPR